MDPAREELDTASGAPPPPPPPPPPPLAGSPLEARLAAVERELSEVRDVQRHMIERLAAMQSASPAHGAPEAQLALAQAEIARLQLQLGSALSAVPAAGDSEAERLRKDVEQLRQANARLLADYERIEGEHQALKLRLEGEKTRRAESAADLAALRTGDPERDAKVEALVGDNERLREELERLRKDAVAKIKSLKSNLDRTKNEFDTVRVQRENLLRELQSRDSGEGGEPLATRELTLEEITASEVFKTMLGNIRRTSRQEVTLLHDAVVKLRAIDPQAHNLVLDLVAKQFKEANVENPLALLPRA